MKRKFIILSCMALWALLTIPACSPEKESPEPVQPSNQNNNGNNNGNGNGGGNTTSSDTMALFADKNWVTNRIYKDGMEDSGDWRKGTSYSINKNKNYFFNIPGFPSATGTWDFDAAGKKQVNFTTSGGPGFKWKIVSISADKLVVEEINGSSGPVMKFEFGH